MLQLRHLSRRLLARLFSLTAWLLLALTVHANAAATEATSPNLYQRMGGAAVVAEVAAELIDQTSHAPEMRHSFRGVNMPRLKRLLAEQICALSGGPCTYTGDSMKEVHAGLRIHEGEFFAMVELLRQILIKHGVGLTERNELLALLAPMKRDVVTH